MLEAPGLSDADPRSEPGDREGWSSPWSRAIAILVLGLTVSIPGLFTIAPVDRDEARFAQASRQMFEAAALAPSERDPGLHSGGVVVPMLGERPRLNKPPLTYWLQALSAAAFSGGDPRRDAIWMYRVPGVLCLIATALMTWRLGTRMLDGRAGFIAGLLIAASPVIVIDAHQARSDLPLLAMTTAAMVWLWRATTPDRAFGLAHAAAFWALLGAAILAKGPIAPMVVGLTIAGLCLMRREVRWVLRLRPAMGVIILAGMIGPWVFAVGERVGWEVYIRTITDETLGRVRRSREGHWGPPGYHLVLMIGLFWPGSLLVGRGVWRAWKRRAESPAAFLFAWLVPAWVVFEAIPSKLPHYTMPMYPALALVSAWCLTRDPPPRPPKAAILGWVVVAPAFALALLVFLANQVRGEASVAGVGAAALLLAGSIAMARSAGVAAWRGNHRGSQFRAIAGSILLLVPALGVIAPRALPGFDTPRLAAAILASSSGDPAEVASLYHEDSLIFALRGRVARLNEPELSAWIAAHPRGIVVVPADHPLAGAGEVVGALRTNPLRRNEPEFVAVRVGGAS